MNLWWRLLENSSVRKTLIGNYRSPNVHIDYKPNNLVLFRKQNAIFGTAVAFNQTLSLTLRFMYTLG